MKRETTWKIESELKRKKILIKDTKKNEEKQKEIERRELKKRKEKIKRIGITAKNNENTDNKEKNCSERIKEIKGNAIRKNWGRERE